MKTTKNLNTPDACAFYSFTGVWTTTWSQFTRHGLFTNSGMASQQASPESMRYIAERLGIPLQPFSLVVCTSTSYAIIYAESIVKPIYFGGWVQKYRIDEL